MLRLRPWLNNMIEFG